MHTKPEKNELQNRETQREHGCLKRSFIIIFTKMSYFTSQEVGNPVQVIKYVNLSRFQPILKLKVTFVGNLVTLKPFFGDFYEFRL